MASGERVGKKDQKRKVHFKIFCLIILPFINNALLLILEILFAQAHGAPPSSAHKRPRKQKASDI